MVQIVIRVCQFYTVLTLQIVCAIQNTILLDIHVKSVHLNVLHVHHLQPIVMVVKVLIEEVRLCVLARIVPIIMIRLMSVNVFFLN